MIHPLPPSPRFLVRLATGLIASASLAQAGVLYDESISGDLSGAFASPTTGGALSLGDNTISGSTVNDPQAGGTDRDYITFNVPVGMALSAITLSQFVSEDNLMFAALTAGSTSVNPSTAGGNLGSMLGYTHPGSADTDALLGTDILDDLAAGQGAAGFSIPLGPGNYTLWLQQTNPQNVSYGFTLTAVPEPAESAGFIAALLVGAVWYRARTRS